MNKTIRTSCPVSSECALHRSILNNLQFGVCTIHPQTYQILYLNEAAITIYNRPVSELTENNLRWLDLIVPEEQEQIQNTLAEFLNTESAGTTNRSLPVEYHLLDPFQQKRLIRHTFWLSFSEELSTPHLDSMLTDITELNQVEQSFQSSQQFIQKIAELSPSILYVYDLVEQRNVYINREIGETLGYTSQEIKAMGASVLQTLIHPEDFAKLGPHYQQFFSANEGETFEIEYRMRHSNGEWRWLISRETLFSKTAEGLPQQLIGTATDITDRKKVEMALQESEARYRAFTNAIPDLMFRQNAEGVYLDFKAPSEGDLAILPETFLGKNMVEVLPPALAQQIQHHIDLAIATSKIQTFDYQLAPLNGSLCDYEARIAPVGANEIIGVIQDISNRKRSEAALRKSQQQLKEAQRIAHIGSWEFDLVTQKITWSEELFHIYGFDPANGEPSFSEVVQMFHPEDQEAFVQAVNAAIANGTSYNLDSRLFRADGSLCYLNARGEAVCNEHAEVVSLVGIAMDITERKQTEATLREREEFLRTLYENVEQSIFVVDVEADETFRFQGWNPAGERICGILSEDAEGKTPQEVFGDEVSAILEQRYINCLEAGTMIAYEESFMNGEVERWSLTSLNPLKDESGHIYRILGTAYDITLRKQAELTLAQQEQFLRSIWEGVDHLIFVLDVLDNGDFRFAAFNPAMEKNSQMRVEDVVGKTLAQVLPADMVPVWRERYASCVEAGTTVSFEERVTEETQEKWWLTTLTPLHYKSNKIFQIIGTAIDITDRRQIELALQQSEAQYRDLAQREALLNRLNQLIRNSLELDTILQTFVQEVRHLLAVDQSLFIWYRNDRNPPVWEVIYEAKKAEVPSLKGIYPVESIQVLSEKLLTLELIQVDDVKTYPETELREFYQSVGYQSVISLPIQTAEGNIGILTCSCSQKKRPWQDSEIELLQAICDQLAIAINQAQLYTKSQESAQQASTKSRELEATLHELQKAQSNLIQSEKMSSLGQLVAGVAHEINNPVNFIYGNLAHANDYVKDLLKIIELYQQHYPQPVLEIVEEMEAVDLDFLIEDLPKLLGSMKVGSERIKDIVKSLRTFSRLDESDMKEVDIQESIESTLMILHHRLKPKSDYPGIQVIKQYGVLPLVQCYAGQLNQVFMNLLSNAIDALEEGDKNRTLQEMKAQPSTIYITTNIQEKILKISISDNGIGMKNEVVSRIFDPFYTTKPVGQGTGLGLSISYQIIVDRHQGRLYCVSEAGQGTEFVIEIPQHQKFYERISHF